jgi:hypothetical protein
LTATTSIVAKRDDLPGHYLPFLSEIGHPLSQTGNYRGARSHLKSTRLDQGSGTLLIELR